MEGVLLVDKPKDWTSFDVVNYVRKIVANHQGLKPKQVKVGHIGTLDPIATGLLVLLIGSKYTKQAANLSKLDKVYEVEMKLGFTSASFDTETELSMESDKVPTLNQIEASIDKFQGKIKQTPPVYSAIKIKGQRAYSLARKGQEVIMPSRDVQIFKIKINSYKYPVVSFDAHVSSGTYIRSLVNDIGADLRTGAVMQSLRRVRIGEFNISKAVLINDLDEKVLERKIVQL